MTDTTIVLSLCATCNSPLRDEINRRIRAGIPLVTISAWLRDANAYISRDALSNHRKRHLYTPVEFERSRQVAELRRQQRTMKTSRTDLAELVRDRAVDGIEAGELAVTVADGLRAQLLLDTRAQKGSDRDLQLQLAMILGGGYRPDTAIEGEVREIDPLVAEHARSMEQRSLQRRIAAPALDD